MSFESFSDPSLAREPVVLVLTCFWYVPFKRRGRKRYKPPSSLLTLAKACSVYAGIAIPCPARAGGLAPSRALVLQSWHRLLSSQAAPPLPTPRKLTLPSCLWRWGDFSQAAALPTREELSSGQDTVFSLFTVRTFLSDTVSFKSCFWQQVGTFFFSFFPKLFLLSLSKVILLVPSPLREGICLMHLNIPYVPGQCPVPGSGRCSVNIWVSQWMCLLPINSSRTLVG